MSSQWVTEKCKLTQWPLGDVVAIQFVIYKHMFHELNPCAFLEILLRWMQKKN